MGHAGIAAVPIPAGGPKGEPLVKQSDDDYDYDWASVSGSGMQARLDAMMYFLGE